MAVFADHGVSLSVYKIVCVCGLGLSCRAWTTSVSLRKWLVKQLVLAKLSIMIPELVSCQYLVVVSQLCLKFHCVLLFGHLASKNHLPGFEKPHTGLLPIFRCSKASNLIAWCGMCFGRCDIGTVQTEDFTATSEQVSRPTLCAHWANEHEFGIQWGATKHPRLAGGFPESLVFLEPCVPGTLSSWNPRFRNLGATHSVYWNPGFPEPRRADLLSRCPPPCQRLLVDRALLVLEPWFPCKLVFWDPVRSMNLGTTHGVYPTPGLFPEPRNLARTLTLSLSGTCGIIQEVYPNCGSASVVVLGTLSEPSVAGTLPESWFPKLWVCRMSQNWCSGDSRTLAQSRLWLLETMVRFPEPCRKPSVPGTFPEPWRPGTQKVARTHCSQNLAWKSGLRNLGFLEPCPEPWFPEPWVPGTLPRTLVPGTGSRNPGSRNRRNEAAGSSSAPEHPEGYVGWDPKAFCCWGIKVQWKRWLKFGWFTF